MKTLSALAIGYLAPTIINHITANSVEMALGVLFGVSMALLIAILFYAPPRRSVRVAAVSKPRRMARKAVVVTKPAYSFVPTNYEWSVA